MASEHHTVPVNPMPICGFPSAGVKPSPPSAAEAVLQDNSSPE